MLRVFEKIGDYFLYSFDHLAIDGSVRLESDSIASVRTAGIIGDRYISIARGGADDLLEPNGEIIDTKSAINLEELVSKYIFEK